MAGSPVKGDADVKPLIGEVTDAPQAANRESQPSSFQAINKRGALNDTSARQSPAPQKAPPLSDADAENNVSVPPEGNYGTRARRGGHQRLNYSEDQEMDFDYNTSVATTGPKKATQAGAEAKRAKEFSQMVASNSGAATPTKEPTAGASTTNVKKRKAATAATSVSTPPAANVPPANYARKPNGSASSALARETNMMSFTKSKACLNKQGQLVSDDGIKLGVNDHVYLVCEPPGEPYYLCRVMEFLHTESDNRDSPVDSIRVNWYYRPRDVQRYNNDSRLVYATMHSDMCPLTSLRGTCTIKHRSEIEDLDAYRKERDAFYFQQVFDRFIRRWYECIPTSQIINVPEKVKKALDERWKFVAVEIGRVKELTSAVKTCKRCTRFCANSDSVDCAICKNSYHMNCVQPPLPKKPSRGFAWACGPCSRASERQLEAQYTPTVSGDVTEVEEEEVREDEDRPAVSNDTTRAPSPTEDEMVVDDHPATLAEVALAKMWPMRYLGIHCRVEDALQYDDRAIYPRASSRLGPRHQANVNVWHGRPVELVKPADIKKRYTKGGSKKEGKLSKETLAAMEADRKEKEKRPMWVQDEPVGYVARGEDYPNDDPRNTAKSLFRLPQLGEDSGRGLDDTPVRPHDYAELIEEYLEKAKPLARKIGVPPFGTNFLDKAIEIYTASGFNEKVALDKLSKVDRKHDLHEPVLTREQLVKFEDGVGKFGSEHRLVRLHMKTTLSNSDIVRFYYLWKKTPKGKEIWGNYPGRKGKKRVDNDAAARLHEEVAHDADDSAFDNDKAIKRKRGFQCKFCNVTHARQWRRAPGTAAGQTVLVEVKGGPKDKKERMLVALCLRCAGLWRKYAIQWEDVDEVAKKVSAGGGRAWKRRIDEELLRELIAANEAAAQMPTPEPALMPHDGLTEPPKKKSKTNAATAASLPEPPKKVEKPPPPPKLPTPPPPPIIPAQPTWKILPCSVCLTGGETISCAHCRLTVHRNCFGLSDAEGMRPDGQVYWVCEQCRNDHNASVSTDYSCCLCLTEETLVDLVEPPKVSHKKKTDREKEKERMEKELADGMRAEYRNRQLTHHRPQVPREPLKRTTGNNWVHVYCAIWTPEIRFSNAHELELAEGIQLIPQSKFEAVCKLCKNKDHHNALREDKGACVSCFQQCGANFHVSCALEAGYQFGFDVRPVKTSRKDAFITATLGSETGAIEPAIWCKEHTVKSIVHPMHEIADDTARTALQVYVENYKQADLTLTGTARKANLVQLTKNKNQTAVQLAQSNNRRESAANSIATAVRRGARNSSVAEAKAAEQDRATEVPEEREHSSLPPERSCVKCKIDVTPRWHMAEGQFPQQEATPPKSPRRRLSMTLGEIADQQQQDQSADPAIQPSGNVDITGAPAPAHPSEPPSRPPQNIRFMAPGASGRAWEGMADRAASRAPVNGDAPTTPTANEGSGSTEATVASSTEPVPPQANGEQRDPPEPAASSDEGFHKYALPQYQNPASPVALKAEVAVPVGPIDYLCHKCFVKRKLDPTPPPPSPPPHVELSPPRTFPLRLEFNGQPPAVAQRPPPRSPWDEQPRSSQAPNHMGQPPSMNGMGHPPGYPVQQPPPPNHGFPPTYHHPPNGYAAPPPNMHERTNGYGFPQPSPNPSPYFAGHRPPMMNGFSNGGPPMHNGMHSPHGQPLQSPTYAHGPPHGQYPPRRTESPFSSQLPPLGGPLYSNTHAAFAGQQQQGQQQQPATSQPSTQAAFATRPEPDMSLGSYGGSIPNIWRGPSSASVQPSPQPTSNGQAPPYGGPMYNNTPPDYPRNEPTQQAPQPPASAPPQANSQMGMSQQSAPAAEPTPAATESQAETRSNTEPGQLHPPPPFAWSASTDGQPSQMPQPPAPSAQGSSESASAGQSATPLEPPRNGTPTPGLGGASASPNLRNLLS